MAGGESPLTLRPDFKCEKGSVTAGGESPLTLRPNFKCEKGSVTADKPPVCPAGGFLLVKTYERVGGDAHIAPCETRQTMFVHNNEKRRGSPVKSFTHLLRFHCPIL